MINKVWSIVLLITMATSFEGLVAFDYYTVGHLVEAATYIQNLSLKPEKCLIVCDVEQTLLFCTKRSPDEVEQKDLGLIQQKNPIKEANRWYAEWLNGGGYILDSTEGPCTAAAVSVLRSLGDVVFTTPRSAACHLVTVSHLQKIGIPMLSPQKKEKNSVFPGPTVGIPDELVVMHDSKIIYCGNGSKEQAIVCYLSCCGKQYDAIVVIDDQLAELEEAWRGASAIKKRYALWYNPQGKTKESMIQKTSKDKY